MKKKTILFAFCAAVIMLTGCTSMILNAYRKIEPMHMTVKAPTAKKFVSRIPDAEIIKNIVGTWKCSSATEGYSKVDINGSPFMYTNTPHQTTENTWTFLADGKCSTKMKSSTYNPQTGRMNETTVSQDGTWKCSNGVISLSLYNEQLKKHMTIQTVAIWDKPDTMELRYDGDSYKHIVEQAMAAAPPQPGINYDGTEFHYDDDGNFYVTIRMSGFRSNMNFKVNVLTKQPRQIFKKVK